MLAEPLESFRDLELMRILVLFDLFRGLVNCTLFVLALEVTEARVVHNLSVGMARVGLLDFVHGRV